MKNLPDTDLFKLVQQDNERAFTILFDRYKVIVFRHVFKRVGAEFEASEILQNIFLSLWKNRSRINIEDSLGPYLMGAARNSVMALYASSQKELKRAHLLLEQPAQLTYPQEEYLVAEELEQQLRRELSKMPETMKKAFELSRYEDLTVREIAAALNLSEQTVKNNLSLALQRLRGKLKVSHFVHVSPFLHFLS
ncbi:RNA polymerase sigma factor [Pontibacter kalidii]|uniref:RNA polymerase sigma factor n=1 Tax=Pontibacter kalidii TaxID=2592049 RepID=UPI0022555A0D|nr:sigma-70 family RNA polymerase sigma factor [Pontibacter kalidii]